MYVGACATVHMCKWTEDNLKDMGPGAWTQAVRLEP